MNKKEIILKTKKLTYNPYPKDVFLWNNPEKITLTKGRLNKLCYEIYENAKNDLTNKLLKEVKKNEFL